MSEMQSMSRGLCSSALIEKIRSNQDKIHRWLKFFEGSKELPLYSSVDIRDAGFKMAVVDTNLFPAGFNNLCPHGLEDAVKLFQTAILHRVPNCKDILIIAEEHTRNTWYLENIRILQQIIEKAGFNVKIAMFFEIHPEFCENANYIELETATQNPVRVFCFKKILAKLETGLTNFDLIILNNDLINGIPDALKKTSIPIYPSEHAGWHSRLKSHHFKHAADLWQEFSRIVGMDDWLFSALFASTGEVDINNDVDRKHVADMASDLFKKIQAKYKEYRIEEKPFIFLKADAGTYGMGVQAIEDPKDILDLNRKARNDLHKGKGGHLIGQYILQEGVSTIHNVDQQVSEVVVYQIANNLIGGFYRSNALKSDRENLNSQGMDFKTICPHLPKYGADEGEHEIVIFDVYRILARIAGIAAHREIIELKRENS